MCETARPPVSDQPVLAGYELLREGAVRVSLPHFSMLEVTGEDRKGWLQGQVTNDLRDLHVGGSIQCCMCTPTGQLLADMSLWALEERFILSVPAAALDAVLQRFESMVILEDVAVRRIEEPLTSVQGPAASRELGRFTELPKLDAGGAQLAGGTAVFLRSNRTGYGGWDILAGGEGVAKVEECLALASDEAYDVARLEAGIPLFGKDTGPRTLPPELGPAFVARHISYGKGCYTGQEVLMRIYSRGHTNRTWMALIANKPIPAGYPVATAKAEIGMVTTSAFSPAFGHIAGAMLRNESVTTGDVVRVQGPDGTVEAEVDQMPLLRFG